MKVKVLWGFVGLAGHVRRGSVIDVDPEYAHSLIGKGLVEAEVEVEVEAKPTATPKNTKPAVPAENK